MRSILAAVLLILAAGLVVAFIAMGPQRHNVASLAPTPTPPAEALLPPTPTPSGPGGPTAPVPTFTPVPEDTPVHVIIPVDLWPPPTDYGRLVRESEIILIGTVLEVQPARWNTADGRRPGRFWSLPREDRRLFFIYTPIVLQVERHIKGSQPMGVLVFGTGGGTVGQDIWEYTGDPQTPFVPGEGVLEFLNKVPGGPPQGPSVTNPPLSNTGTNHTITADGRAKYRDVDLPLDEVVRRIEAAAACK